MYTLADLNYDMLCILGFYAYVAIRIINKLLDEEGDD